MRCIVLLFCIITIAISLEDDLKRFTKIMGGQIVQDRSQFSYQVVVYRIDGIFCGGTLVNSKNVVTAAHCVVSDDGVQHKPDEFEIYSGILSLNQMNKDILEIQSIFVHPRFKIQGFEDDIAILRIEEAKIDQYVKPVTIAQSKIAEGTACKVSGWGSLDPEGVLSNDLRYVTVPIFPLTDCNSTNSYEGFIKRGMICAGYPTGKKDACFGDSGGPLVCDNQLAGVVSWGRSCGEPNLPGVYTDVFYYKEWLEEQFKKSSTQNSGLHSVLFPSVLTLVTVKIIYCDK